MFSVGFPIGERVRNALADLPIIVWANGRSDGARREGAAVAELCTLPFRLACRRSGDRSPTATASWRPARFARRRWVWITCFLTDQPDADLVDLDRHHRGHARVEDSIRNVKDTGLVFSRRSFFNV